VSRTRVPRWAPPFAQALRLALRPIVAYLVFCVGGFVALLGTIVYDEGFRGKEDGTMLLAIGAGFVGILAGQLVGVLRARQLPVFVVGGATLALGFWLIATNGADLPEEVSVPIFFFCFAFPCGLLSLQHRWELFASFWPAVGWIGAAFVLIDRQHRLADWRVDKMLVWSPGPLVFLGLFLFLWLLYLASKQAVRVELWQSLSGAAARRIAKKPSVGAVPRRNLLPIVGLAIALFALVAVLSPYLFRTGPGKHDDGGGEPSHETPRAPDLDAEGLMKQLRRMLDAAEQAAVHLWPLLFLVVLYRPAKRALLKTHLLTPVVPTPPTERIENLWEYVRIAAEDAGVAPAPSDSVEQLLARIRAANLGGPGLSAAASIYARTRYGFTVAPGDPLAMRPRAIEAARELRVRVTGLRRVTNWWRPLS
jgi:hypothetical protein